MASNDEYQQRQLFEKTWLQKIEDEYKENLRADLEKIAYSADEGSLLDRIWNKEKINNN
jgi:hypothetical protein